MTTLETAPGVTPFADLLDLTNKRHRLVISRRLAEAGASVVVADLDDDGARPPSAALVDDGLVSRPFRLDVSDEQRVRELFAFVADDLGGVDVLVNNAGIFPQVPIREMSAAIFDRVIAVNLRGLYLCTKAPSPAPGFGDITRTVRLVDFRIAIRAIPDAMRHPRCDCDRRKEV
jgi:NAD(P)-dependent dehydrogenase (short-subunit alcohol dehydrogenase family)